MLRDGLARFLINLQRADDALFVCRVEPRGGLRVNFAQPSQHGLAARFAQLRLERFAPAGLRDRCERPACNQTVNIQPRTARNDGGFAAR